MTFISNEEELKYLQLMEHILKNGNDQPDRTGVGTKSVFGTQLKFSLKNNVLPILTTKKMFFRGAIEETLFFIRGETNTKKLEEKGVNIWKPNTSRTFLDSRGLFEYPEGEMGPMYGSLWRSFNGVDQLKNALHLLKTDPNSRRIMITAYDPSLLYRSVLAPCHFFQEYYVHNGKLSCQWHQRSVDYGIGLGFNIISYGVLTHLMAKASGLEAEELIFVGGNTHIYNNYLNQAKEQISRQPYPFPKINIKKNVSSIEDMENLCFEDFEIIDYQYHPAIKAEMAI